MTIKNSFALISFLSVLAIGCGGDNNTTAKKEKTDTAPSKEKKASENTPTKGGMKGEIKADGSSTVLLISQAVASEYSKTNPNVKISVGRSGTGGGFKKFAAGEIDISNASRPIKAEEKASCAKNGIEFFEFQVAWDGLSIVINKENTWAKNMTVAQLKSVWDKDSKVENWSDIDPTYPKEKIKLFGAGTDSGTFDFFTEVINGKAGQSRTSYQPTEDDNVTVNGVSKDKFAMGYFGLAYYEENKEKLGIVSVAKKEGDKFISPSEVTVMDKTYSPLSRPLYIYVKKSSLKRPEVQDFMTFFLRRNDLISQAKYIKMDALMQADEQEKLAKAIKEAGQ
jgi:phosphate transport system substrate-binding protein